MTKKFNAEPPIPWQNTPKTGVLLINLGTPQAPAPQAVRPYLREFLSDYRVVELPALLWQPLLRGVILPLRGKKSAHGYEKIWLKEGSPLAVFTQRQAAGLRARLPENVSVAHAMTYGKPSISDAIKELKHQGVRQLVVLPLYPQYAGSATGAALDKVLQSMLSQRNQPSLHTISRFYQHEGYIRAAANQIRAYRAEHGAGEQLLLSFHGIPQRHHDLGDPYPKECFETARLIAQALQLNEHEYIVAFQSRFGRGKWLEPSTQTLLDTLPRRGIQKLDVFCPGFVSDCLETMEEIAIAGREQFHKAGGTQFHYIPCLNDNPDWLDALADLVRQEAGAWLS